MITNRRELYLALKTLVTGQGETISIDFLFNDLTLDEWDQLRGAGCLKYDLPNKKYLILGGPLCARAADLISLENSAPKPEPDYLDIVKDLCS